MSNGALSAVPVVRCVDDNCIIGEAGREERLGEWRDERRGLPEPRKYKKVAEGFPLERRRS